MVNEQFPDKSISLAKSCAVHCQEPPPINNDGRNDFSIKKLSVIHLY